MLEILPESLLVLNGNDAAVGREVGLCFVERRGGHFAPDESGGNGPEIYGASESVGHSCQTRYIPYPASLLHLFPR